MSERDDIVIRPSLGPMRPHQKGPRERVKEERRVAEITRGKRGPVSRLMRIAKARRALALARGARGGGLGRVGRVVRSPAGAAIAALIAAGVVAVRLATGRSFENMGQQINDAVLGDLDDQARAAATARNHLMSKGDVMSMYAQDEGVRSQVRTVFEGMKRLNLREERGRSMILADKRMQVNGLLDMVILRGQQWFANSPTWQQFESTCQRAFGSIKGGR